MFDAAGHYSLAPVSEVDVVFQADAEFAGKIDPGLDGKAGVRDQLSEIEGLEAVDMGAGAMIFGVDVMTCAVGEIAAVAFVFDHFPAHPAVPMPAGSRNIATSATVQFRNVLIDR